MDSSSNTGPQVEKKHNNILLWTLVFFLVGGIVYLLFLGFAYFTSISFSPKLVTREIIVTPTPDPKYAVDAPIPLLSHCGLQNDIEKTLSENSFLTNMHVTGTFEGILSAVSIRSPESADILLKKQNSSSEIKLTVTELPERPLAAEDNDTRLIIASIEQSVGKIQLVYDKTQSKYTKISSLAKGQQISLQFDCTPAHDAINIQQSFRITRVTILKQP
jgi:hypothetical protein